MPDSNPSSFDDAHRRPDGVDDATVAAVGRVSEAWEYTARARGHLYAFHQLTGSADRILHDAVDMLRRAGHRDAARLLETEIAGRNVIPGHWTFQIVEGYDRTYYQPFADAEQRLRDDLVGGRRHLYEAEMKQRLRTRGHPDHTLD
ncbi:hypothetical protein B4N89_41390 [Embleya scabrispora]|uniref:Uncharacterized protein n=1 Tax=Embleya scabrispora TaxID=159449 RepID=A0A1T3NJQ5_9ACTN|nr:hypothetical protein [Embleya scabrispora]OPC77032.1 hypothetical protein B4N89_41390 [Embleya scabrispora]